MKQSTNIATANSASISRVRSSGTCSSIVGGCRNVRPNIRNRATIRKVHVSQLAATKYPSASVAPIVTNVTAVERRREQPEPGGKGHRVQVHRVAFGRCPKEQVRGELEEQRLAERYPDEVR